LSAWTAGQEAQKAAEKKPKFLEDSGMSFQEVSDFAFKGFYIPNPKSLAQDIKNTDLTEILKNIPLVFLPRLSAKPRMPGRGWRG
jgi:hypothetical protein